MNNLGFYLGLILIIVGIVFTGLSTGSFKLRALMNKKAWEGLTIPSLILGLVSLVLGAILLALNYPF